MTGTNHYDLLIRGGTVIDGTRRPRFAADVAVRGGRIAAVGDLRGCTAAQTIDATGRIVAPGFIDSHTHDDQALISEPDVPFKISQGVTTVVTGNCGISAAPLRPGAELPMPLKLLDAGGGGRFTTFRAYLDALEALPPAVNVVPMVGHTNLRTIVMDDLDRPATPDEAAAMRALLEEALAAGAVGMSTGTYYPPAAAATTDEVIAVSRPLAARRALYVAHIRNEADRCMEAVEETFQIGREVGTPVLLSHHKHMRQANFGKSVATLRRIEEEMRCQCVSLDCYPYTASSTMLHLDEERLQGRITIASSEAHPELQGKDLQDIADAWGVSRVEASRRLQPASAIYYSMDEADVQRILAFEPTMVGSDGIPTGERPHPRLWGTFPRVLGRYSRDIGLFPLETAVWKMTGLTAQVFGLEGRGAITEGHRADITVFDAQTVRDVADYDNPVAPAEGIDAVVVNGVVAYLHGTHTRARSGQVLRRTPVL
ncbi:N-acyl-D-amino-acid deacylase family protein [Xylophilus sp.]|uniref:N-acyl-D-amino-acid deacylase family protein n=1 Tax=Xylophilus sp. TaxID=2653893 RepID=UPI0013BDF29D|nr:D-aminoacylase [Xylophilus sp.]KAF1050106.1 MAG: D-aminoacylase [Xylophilus sp.]